jgi:hypothetical protein
LATYKKDPKEKLRKVWTLSTLFRLL